MDFFTSVSQKILLYAAKDQALSESHLKNEIASRHLASSAYSETTGAEDHVSRYFLVGLSYVVHVPSHPI